jgi:hypothetical protein
MAVHKTVRVSVDSYRYLKDLATEQGTSVIQIIGDVVGAHKASAFWDKLHKQAAEIKPDVEVKQEFPEESPDQDPD